MLWQAVQRGVDGAFPFSAHSSSEALLLFSTHTHTHPATNSAESPADLSSSSIQSGTFYLEMAPEATG